MVAPWACGDDDSGGPADGGPRDQVVSEAQAPPDTGPPGDTTDDHGAPPDAPAPDNDAAQQDFGLGEYIPADFWLPEIGPSPDSLLCTGGLTWCNSMCVDTASDPDHCGGCNNACPAGDTCVDPVCNASQCGSDPVLDGTPCTDGTCYSGSCCTGCWDGAACKAGQSALLCGIGGETCKVCPVGSQPCQEATCLDGLCNIADKTKGDACPGGTCLNGSCCEGCVSGNACMAGDSTFACGDEGAQCQECPASTACSIYSCTGGACVDEKQPDTTICPGGTCVDGACCDGCTEQPPGGDLQCHVGDTDALCGIGGGTCNHCDDLGQQCVAGVCVP